MTNDELNEKIRQACTHAAPDVLDAVLSDCNEQKGRVILMTTENKKKTWAVRMAGLAAGLCLILGGGLGVRNYQVNHTVDATVSLEDQSEGTYIGCDSAERGWQNHCR